MKKFYLLLFSLFCLHGLSWADSRDLLISKKSLDNITTTFSTSGAYEWEWDFENERLQSTNRLVHNSTSQTTITINMPMAGTFSFDFAVSCEDEDYNSDVLTVSLDNSPLTLKSGYSSGVYGEMQGNYSGNLSSGRHTLVLMYKKDGSISDGEDRAYISNFRITLPKIYYTSSVSRQVRGFNPSLVSNTFSNGQGCWTFSTLPTYIDDNAYEDSACPDNILFPYGFRYIGTYAFSESFLERVTLPETVVYIEESAFSDSYIASVTNLATNPQTIDATVFRWNKDHMTLHVKPGRGAAYRASAWGQYFDNIVEDAGAPNVIYYTSDNGAIVNPDPNAFGGVTIHSNTYQNGMGKIVFENVVTSISYLAFAECTHLRSITIPSEVSSIGHSIFRGCTALEHIYVDTRNLYYFDDNRDAIFDLDDRLIAGCKNSRLRYMTATIEAGAFWNISTLTSIDWSESNYLSGIRSNAFSGTGFTRLNIPNKVTEIGSSAFSNCVNLTSVSLPTTLTTIGNSAFEGCTSLTSVTDYAAVAQAINAGTFEDTPLNKNLHIMAPSKPDYIAKNWGGFNIVPDVTVPASTLTDGNSYTVEDGHLVADFTYTRDFNSTDYQALYVPFSVPVSTLNSYGLTVLEIFNVHQYDLNGDDIYDETKIDFLTKTEGSIRPNHPYIVKRNATGNVTIKLKNANLAGSESAGIDCSTTHQTYTFMGTYTGVSGSEMYGNNYYALAGGDFKRASSSAASLKPQRWYMKIENRDGTDVQYFAPTIRITVDGIEDEEQTSSLAEFFGNSTDASTIYNAAGVKMTVSDKSQLPAGVYVQGGKKFIVK